jgi:hypothetical protein
MTTRSSALKILKGALCGLALVALTLSLGTGSAAARGRVFLGFGFASPPAYYYPPPYYYPPTYYQPYYYYPPPVAYGPPPVYGSFQPQPVAPAYQSPSGQTCREYQTTVTVDGQARPGYGTACLQPDGTWRMIN